MGSNLSGCSLSSLYCALHVAAPFCGRLCARKVQPANGLPQYPEEQENTENKTHSRAATINQHCYLCYRIFSCLNECDNGTTDFTTTCFLLCVCVCVGIHHLPAILGKDSWGEIGSVAATRVLLFTPVLLLIVHRLTDTSEHMVGLGTQLYSSFLTLFPNSHAGPLPSQALWSRSHRSSSA